jgi:hypothetical protein
MHQGSPCAKDSGIGAMVGTDVPVARPVVVMSALKERTRDYSMYLLSLRHDNRHVAIENCWLSAEFNRDYLDLRCPVAWMSG